MTRYYDLDHDSDLAQLNDALSRVGDAHDADIEARTASAMQDWNRERTARTVWNLQNPDGDDRGDSEWVGAGHPAVAAMKVVRRALSSYQLHGDLSLAPGMLERRAGNGQYATTDGRVMVQGRIALPSGHTVNFEAPVNIKGARAREPAVIRVDGITHVIAQQTFDSLRDSSTFMQKELLRSNMFSPPPDDPDRAGERPIVRPGMFRTLASELRGAAGSAEGRPQTRLMSRQAYLQDVDLGLQDVEWNGEAGVPLDDQDADWRGLDPAERPVDVERGNIFVGATVRAAKDIVIKGTGIRIDTIPKGTEGLVLRDFDGTGNSWIVEFPGRTVNALAIDLKG